MTTRRRYGRLPDNAPCLCDDPAALNPDPVPARRARFLAIQVRRARRLVRRVFRCARRLWRRGRPAWTARGRGGFGVAHCPRTACRYHLAEFYREEALDEACALVVLRKRGPLTQPDLGRLLHMTHANVGVMERAVFDRMRERRRRNGDGDEERGTLEERVLKVLRYGEGNATEISYKVGATSNNVRLMLQALEADGKATSREGSCREGRLWRIVAG